MGRHKRKSGGQPGNQNARKHGFYSANLSEKELSEYWQLVNNQGMDPQLALVRVKLCAVLSYQVGKSPFGKGRDRGISKRILMEGTNLIAKTVKNMPGMDEDGCQSVKQAARAVLQAAVTGEVELTKQVGSEILKVLENSQNE